MAGFDAVEENLITRERLLEALCAVVVVCVYAVAYDHRVDLAFFSFDPSEYSARCECPRVVCRVDWRPVLIYVRTV
jgi:hypothetical protein